MSTFYTHAINRRNRILVCGYHDGERFLEQVKYEPYMFVPTKEDTEYHTIEGLPVTKKTFPSQYEMRKFRDLYSNVDGFEIYGLEHPHYLYLYDHYRKVDYDPLLIQTLYLDIEVDSENGYPDIERADREINAITMLYQNTSFVFGYGDYTPPDNSIHYVKCKNEHDLLTKFMKVWTSPTFRPDVVTGWACEFFDIPYIVMRLVNVLGHDVACKLSPWGLLEDKKLMSFGKENTVYTPVGVSVLDYMALYKKYVAVYKPQESYRLDHIAKEELNQQKLDYSEYGSLHKLYVGNHQKFIDYNLLDCQLVWRLNEKLRLLELTYQVAYDSGVNFMDVISPVKTWDITIHNFLLDRNIVVPKNKNNKKSNLAGGYVKAPLVGMHEWLVSFDLTSLYPHLIMQYNIGPDTFFSELKQKYTAEELIDGKHHKLHEYLDKHNLSFAANSCVYKKNKQSFLSILMQEMFEKRVVVKDRMQVLKQEREDSQDSTLHDDEITKLDTEQYAIKIRLNSAYGALANEWFRWYDLRFAESITLSGQMTIKWISAKMNQFFNEHFSTDGVDYVIAVDTDSVYINMQPLIKILQDHPGNLLLNETTDDICKAVDYFCDKVVQPFLNVIFEELSVSMRSYRQAMDMKREVIADRGFWVAKKRYGLNVLNNEGVQYDEPDVKILGFESRRSSTPSSCRSAIKEAITIILQDDEETLQKFIATFQVKFNTLPFAEIAKNSSVNGLTKYADSDTIYSKKTPIHVRGSLLFNRLLSKSEHTNDCDPIFEGDKVKFSYLIMPNPIGENVIACVNDLPEWTGLHEYIDRDEQFIRNFLEPMRSILSVIGWTEEPINKVTGFFK